jgi:hypothetical protein
MGTDPGTERDMQYEHLTTQKVVASVIVDWLKPTRGATAPGGEAGRIRDFLLRSNKLERTSNFSSPDARSPSLARSTSVMTAGAQGRSSSAWWIRRSIQYHWASNSNTTLATAAGVLL